MELLHNWLPANDDANVRRYWVPRPDEIEREKAKLREARLQRGGNGFSEDFEPNLDAFAPPRRSQPI